MHATHCFYRHRNDKTVVCCKTVRKLWPYAVRRLIITTHTERNGGGWVRFTLIYTLKDIKYQILNILQCMNVLVVSMVYLTFNKRSGSQ